MGLLRLVGIFLLVVIGFGTGICGLFGIITEVRRKEELWEVVVLFSVIGILVSVGCFFAIRALIRRDRRAKE
jgi:hypothetical protein